VCLHDRRIEIQSRSVGVSFMSSLASLRGRGRNALHNHYPPPCFYVTQTFSDCVRFEVFTAVTMKNGAFWEVTPCGSCISWQRASVASYG
jgi:hypothetical protein